MLIFIRLFLWELPKEKPLPDRRFWKLLLLRCSLGEGAGTWRKRGKISSLPWRFFGLFRRIKGKNCSFAY